MKRKLHCMYKLGVPRDNVKKNAEDFHEPSILQNVEAFVSCLHTTLHKNKYRCYINGCEPRTGMQERETLPERSRVNMMQRVETSKTKCRRVKEYFHLNGKQSQFGSLHFQVTSLKRVCSIPYQMLHKLHAYIPTASNPSWAITSKNKWTKTIIRTEREWQQKIAHYYVEPCDFFTIRSHI